MPQVRCPQCGAVNDTNAPDYPFCIGCQDNLAKCGHCRWFDRDALLCLSPVAAGLFDSVPDATLPCDQHLPGETVLVRGGRGYLPFAIVGAVVALLVLVYAVWALRAPARPAGTLRLALEADYRGATLGVPYVVRVELQNPADRVVEGIRLQLSKASLRNFDLLKVVPKESAREGRRGEWLALLYPALQPRETKRIDLHLRPTAVGTHDLAVRLISGGNTYYGQADLPITVAERPAEDGRDETGRRAVD